VSIFVRGLDALGSEQPVIPPVELPQGQPGPPSNLRIANVICTVSRGSHLTRQRNAAAQPFTGRRAPHAGRAAESDCTREGEARENLQPGPRVQSCLPFHEFQGHALKHDKFIPRAA
jgi:hypothetical protein